MHIENLKKGDYILVLNIPEPDIVMFEVPIVREINPKGIDPTPLKIISITAPYLLVQNREDYSVFHIDTRCQRVTKCSKQHADAFFSPPLPKEATEQSCSNCGHKLSEKQISGKFWKHCTQCQHTVIKL